MDSTKKKFSRVFRGYNSQEVDYYLEQQAFRYEDLKRDYQKLSAEIEEAKAEIRQYREREKNLEEAISQTRQMADDITGQAEREAKLIVAESELRSEKILNQAHQRLANIHEDIAELKRQRTQFEVRLRSLVEAHLKLIDLERDRDREWAEMEDKVRILRSPSGQ